MEMALILALKRYYIMILMGKMSIKTSKRPIKIKLLEQEQSVRIYNADNEYNMRNVQNV